SLLLNVSGRFPTNSFRLPPGGRGAGPAGTAPIGDSAADRGGRAGSSEAFGSPPGFRRASRSSEVGSVAGPGLGGRRNHLSHRRNADSVPLAGPAEAGRSASGGSPLGRGKVAWKSSILSAEASSRVHFSDCSTARRNPSVSSRAERGR